MTPERAAELATRIRADYAISMGAKEAIQQAILAACKEQKELDAKICEGIGPDDWTGENCAKAIRGGEIDSEWRREKTAQQNIESLLAKILELQKENELLRGAKPNMATSLVKMARQLEEYERFLNRNGMQKDAAIRGAE